MPVHGLMARKRGMPRSKAVIDLAIAALRGGNVAKARMLLHDRLIEDPFDADALAKLAEIAVEEGQYDQATIFLRRAATADPSVEAQIAVVRHMHKYGSPATVLNEIEGLSPVARSETAIMAIEASASGSVGAHDRQISLFKALTQKSPANPSLWNSLGNALKTVGRVDEGVAAIKRAIKVRPTYGNGYWSLANFKSYRFNERDVGVMKRALGKKLTPQEALHFHFALGKAYEDKEEFEPSYRHYAAGNKIRASSVNPEQAVVTEAVDSAIRFLAKGFFVRKHSGECTEAGPIFVVGMHRAGSTLIEQILASHPQVEGTAELPVMNQIRDRMRRAAKARGVDYWQALAEVEDKEFHHIGQEYMDRTRPFRRTNRPYFVDKMPSNWLNVALIHRALPNAIIIDARRHPLACGFSNFKQNYASGAAYSYDLETMGKFYYDYWRFVRHIDSLAPGLIHRVVNEHLVDNPEKVIRRLLEHCKLPFDAACLTFHNNTRAVRTPSAEQVRRPINSDGVNSWRSYERWLDPLKVALGDALDGWDD